MFDLVIRNGTVVDGTGAAAREADVAVEAGAIAAVGAGLGRGKREIDARGLLVTPGFVDIHTHYDAQATWDPYLTPSSWHGCTTVVMGSCGVGFAPAHPDRHDWLIQLMEGVEDIPGSAMTEGMRWGWESFPEYLDALARAPRILDYAAQVPHGALRAYVMGERGAKNEPATREDIARMYELTLGGLRAGALGFSTSRTLLHRAKDGELVPGTFASAEELFGIGRALRDAGHGVFQVAADHARVPEEIPWMKALSLEMGCAVTFNLSQIDQAPDLWKEGLRLLEEAERGGARLYAQVAGRAIGILMGWDATAHPFVGHPSYQALAHLPLAERVRALRQPEVRARILAERPVDLGPFGNFVTQSFHKMFRLVGGIEYEPAAETSLASLAQQSARSPLELAYEALLEDEGRAMLYFPLFNYANYDLELLHGLHRHPRTLIGLGDAGAHCGAICDGGIPTFMLTHWTRDRARGPRLPLELVVRRQTHDTARAFGLHDRGLLLPGYKADLNVIDYDRLQFTPPELVFDLPAGGRRLAQRAKGYVATVVSGTIVSAHDEPTGALPGELVRGPQPAPAC